RSHRRLRDPGTADWMGAGYCDRRATVYGSGLAVAAFAGTSPGGHSRRRGTSILAIGGWSDCGSRHAAAEDWAALMIRRDRLIHTMSRLPTSIFGRQTKHDKATSPAR